MPVESVSTKSRIAWIINIIFQQALAVVIVFIITTTFVNNDADSLDTWHFVLPPLGITLLMMEGVVLFSSDNVFTLGIPRHKRRLIHSSLLCLSTILITIGISFKISSKSDRNLSHFTTTHGILGLVAWIFSWIAVFFGILSFQAQVLKKIILPVWNKLCHILIGLIAITFGVISLGFGLNEYFIFLSHQNTITAVIVTVAILYAYTLICASRTIYNHIRTILRK